jgi:hypothetical protein
MNIPEMAALARDHWQKTNPRVYRRMVSDNALVSESEAAVKLTLMEMNALMLLKKTEQEAWQESRHLFIFLTKEKLAESYNPR